MEIETLRKKHSEFVKEFENKIDNFNKRTGAYDYEGMRRRVEAAHYFLTDANDSDYLAIADLVDEIYNSDFYKAIDEFATEREWVNLSHPVKWDSDLSKIALIQYEARMEDFGLSHITPFCYYKRVSPETFQVAGAGLIRFCKDEEGAYKAEIPNPHPIFYQLTIIDER